ncbi:polysaccharide biosynthesis protein [Carboxydochorda subterranea]|uniref:Polysaccharide biosynthesis protein n=1 Tax=Carboxydichorda subterranea TaxID=3109565 RepID=A0ABZ1BYB2_9FIRM|nr:polysaccharide biosynthesis protein [Limnochorda sp. L945t]WRP17777.1 polysaccharide biosynthesis protein [Limnochorda sp. L945t]
MDNVIRRLQMRLFGRFPALRPGRFGWGAAQLSGASLLSRLIGFVYSATVMRLAGPEAVGLFRMVWPLYATAFTVAAAGIPYAISKLLAESTAAGAAGEAGKEAGPPRSPRSIALQGLGLLLVNSVVTAVTLWFAAPWLVATLGSEPRAVPILQLLAPSLVAAALSAGAKALFEGIRRMAVPAASLITEQIVLSAVAVGLTLQLARWASSPETAASALAFASVLGEVAGLVVMVVAVDRLWKTWDAARAQEAPGGRGRASWWPSAILSLSLPVAGGRILSSVGASLTTLLLPNRLHAAGLTPSQAAAEIGLLRGVALPLVLTPNMLSLALMTTLVPSISKALARGDRDSARAYSDKALATTVLLSLPATAALVGLPELWTRTLYGEPAAAPLLVVSALGAPFAYLGQTLVGVLRGLGRPDIPVRGHILGMAVEATLIWKWVGQPALGIRGAALASVVGYAVAYSINQVAAMRHLGTELRGRAFLGPLVAAVLGAVAGRIGAAAVAAWLQGAGQLPAFVVDAVALVTGLGVLGLFYGAALRSSPVWRWLAA